MIFNDFPPRVTEKEAFQYSIGLSTGLDRSANVVVTLEAVSTKPELVCTVSPTLLVFYPENETFDFSQKKVKLLVYFSKYAYE